jgi:ketosteroid isomerase-like protein
VSRENVEIVRRIYEAWNSGNAEAAIEVLAPEVEWHVQPNFPDPGTWRGRDEVVQRLTDVAGSWDRLRINVQELIDAGDRVVALVRFHGRSSITGMELEGAGVDAQVWTLRDGLVVDVRMFSGTREALQAVGLA